ncbi:UNVERIFIED_CONTAM: myosin I [Hammondia hammondi]|eukprot:XP_008885736.1 myosin I [Hammondia hammondi]
MELAAGSGTPLASAAKETTSSCSLSETSETCVIRPAQELNIHRDCRGASSFDDSPGRTDLLGSWFWVGHPTKLWTVARLAEIHAEDGNGENALQGNADATCVVEFQDGGFAEMRLADLRGSVDSPRLLKGVDDLLALGELTEASLLHSIRTRFSRFDIYTAIGSHILLSINPCEPLPALFDEAAMEACRKAAVAQEALEAESCGDSPHAEETTGASPVGSNGAAPASMRARTKPHIFITAQRAHSRLFREGKCQSIIISGESGAGKTEGTKLILRYLAHLKPLTSGEGSGRKTQRISLEDRVLRTNPVLEAFGNAKTCRNDNSSRFGKFTLIYFEPRTRRISAAGLNTYLLETCRLVAHSRDERNFHVFYQLVDGARQFLSPEFQAELRLSPSASSFSYLTPQGPPRTETAVSWGRDEFLGDAWVLEDPVSQEENAANFQELLACFTHLGFSQEERENVLRVLAAILHLGNVRFDERPGGVGARVREGQPELEEGGERGEAEIEKKEEGPDESQVETIARLLSIDAGSLYELFRVQKFIDPVTKQDLQLPRTAEKAAEIRDTLAKYIYNHLFSWLVCRLNLAVDLPVEELSSEEGAPAPSSLPSSPPLREAGINSLDKTRRPVPMTASSLLSGKERDSRLFIGLLDIYGFEVFAANSFEQLCINYANEKLQQHFNHHIFSLEQATYAAEGIAWEQIQFTDNKRVIDTLERKVTGLFALLDSENIMPRATDRSFLRKLLASKSTEQPSVQPAENKLNEATHFRIVHYAGPVEYNVEGFLEKNRSSFSREIADLVSTSTSACLQDLCSFLQPREEDDRGQFSSLSTLSSRSFSRCLSSAYDPTAGANRRVTKSISAVFKEQVRGLLETIEETDPFYVRCIKPSAQKGRGLFESADVLRQLRCAGVLETVRIRRDGYPVRLPFSGFLGQFSCLSAEAMAPALASASGFDCAGERSGDEKKRDTQISQGDRDMCLTLLEALTRMLAKDGVLDQSFAWQVGKTKVFLKKPLMDALERAAAKFRFRAATCISKHFRGFVERRRYQQARAAIVRLQARCRGVLRFRRMVREFRERREREAQQRLLQSAASVSQERDADLTVARDPETKSAETAEPREAAKAEAPGFVQGPREEAGNALSQETFASHSLPEEANEAAPTLLTSLPPSEEGEVSAAKRRSQDEEKDETEHAASNRRAEDETRVAELEARSLVARPREEEGDPRQQEAREDSSSREADHQRKGREDRGKRRARRHHRALSDDSSWSEAVGDVSARPRTSRKSRDSSIFWQSVVKTLLSEKLERDHSSTRALSTNEQLAGFASDSASEASSSEDLDAVLDDVVALRARLAAAKGATKNSTSEARERRSWKSRPGFCSTAEEAMYRALCQERATLTQEYLRAHEELLRHTRAQTRSADSRSHSGLPVETARTAEASQTSQETPCELDPSALWARVLLKLTHLETLTSCCLRLPTASHSCGLPGSAEETEETRVLLCLALNQLLRGSFAGNALSQKLVAAYVTSLLKAGVRHAPLENGDEAGECAKDETTDAFVAAALQRLELGPAGSMQRMQQSRKNTSLAGRRQTLYPEAASACFGSAPDAASVYTAHEQPSSADATREVSASVDPSERPGFWTRLFRRLRTLPLIGAAYQSSEETDSNSESSEGEGSDAESEKEDPASRDSVAGPEVSRGREGRTARPRSANDADQSTRSPSAGSFRSVCSHPQADRVARVTRAEFDQLRGQVETLQQGVDRCCGLLEEIKVHLFRTSERLPTLCNLSTMGTMSSAFDSVGGLSEKVLGKYEAGLDLNACGAGGVSLPKCAAAHIRPVG